MICHSVCVLYFTAGHSQQQQSGDLALFNQSNLSCFTSQQVYFFYWVCFEGENNEHL